MDREEKIAYWLFTNLFKDRINPNNINLLDVDDEKRVLAYAMMVYEYDKLIPRNIFDYIVMSGITPNELKQYAKSFTDVDPKDRRYTSELGVTTLKILLDNILEQEAVEVNEKPNALLSPREMKRLERFIFGNVRERKLYEGCDVVCGYVN